MPDVRPFRPLRYDSAVAGDLSQLVAPPYDVLDEPQQAALRRRSPFNIVHLDCGKGGPDYDHTRYAEAGRLFRQWSAQGAVRQQDQPSFFLCRHQFALSTAPSNQARFRRELYAAVRGEPWSAQAVLPHENTRSAARGDRVRLLEACAAVLSPVLGVYEDSSGALAHAFERVEQEAPQTTATLNGERMELWALPADLNTLAAGILGAGPIVVADGHHRYEAGVAYAEAHCSTGCRGDEAAHFTLIALVEASDPGLLILPYYRSLRRLGGERFEQLRALLGTCYEAAPFGGTLAELVACLASAAAPRPLALATADGLTLLAPRGIDLAQRLPDEHSLAWRSLEVSQVQELVLRPLLGCSAEEAERQGFLSYTSDVAQAVAVVNRGEGEAVLLLPPTTMAQVQAVAKDGERVPPKSTYFYPKAPAGLLMMSLEGSL